MRTQRSVLSFAVSGLSVVCLPVLADEVPPDTIVITATGIPTPQSQVASSITVVTAAEIAARQERTLPEVLKDVPGLNVVQAGGPGGQTSIFMRGTNSNHTKVFIDGIDVDDPSSPNDAFDFSQLLTSDIERVEVLRGPQSGLYGSDAIGGVINILTKSGNGPAQLDARVEGGSFDTFNQMASLRGSDGVFHYTANLEHFHSGSTPVTPLDLLQPGETRNNDYYDNLTASTKLGLDLSEHLDVGLVARQSETHLRLTGEDFLPVPPFTGVPAAQQSENDTVETYARVFAHLASGITDQTLGYAYTRKRTADYEPESPVGVTTGERTKLDWRQIVKASSTQTVLLGAEYASDRIRAPLSASDTLTSGYLELQSHLGEGLATAVNVRYDDHSLFGGRTTYRFAPTYVIAATGTKLNASIGTGFKAPTLSQLFESFPAFNFFANPALKPETSTGWDAGFEQDLGATVRLGATYFHNRLHDLIEGTATTNVNVGKATTYGVESFLSWQPLASLSLRADWTYTQATDDILRQDLLRRPKQKLGATGSWQATSALSFSATVETLSTWLDDTRDGSAMLNAPGYTTVNLAGSYDINPHLRVFARVNNLLDRHYENPTGFLQPSLGAFGGVEVKL